MRSFDQVINSVDRKWSKMVENGRGSQIGRMSSVEMGVYKTPIFDRSTMFDSQFDVSKQKG